MTSIKEAASLVYCVQFCCQHTASFCQLLTWHPWRDMLNPLLRTDYVRYYVTAGVSAAAAEPVDMTASPAVDADLSTGGRGTDTNTAARYGHWCQAPNSTSSQLNVISSIVQQLSNLGTLEYSTCCCMCIVTGTEQAHASSLLLVTQPMQDTGGFCRREAESMSSPTFQKKIRDNAQKFEFQVIASCTVHLMVKVVSMYGALPMLSGPPSVLSSSSVQCCADP